MSKDETESQDRDVVVLRGPTEDGEGIAVYRARDGNLEAGELRALKQGAPMSGEVVRLVPREGSPVLWNVRVEFDARETAAPEPAAATTGGKGHAGPARVSTRAYREGWDAIFSSREPGDSQLN
jgi:hypothetical protein